MDSLYIRLQRRVQMCQVEQIGLFNFHFESTGTLGATVREMAPSLFKQTKKSGKVAAVFMSPAAITVYQTRTMEGHDFAGLQMSKAVSLFGDPEVSSSPEAWCP